MTMLIYFHQLSAFLFYVLGTSYFTSYLLHYNALGGAWPLWWMQIADLPTALVAMLYGGLSLYRSVTGDTEHSRGLVLFITIPLVTLFGLFVVLNFVP